MSSIAKPPLKSAAPRKVKPFKLFAWIVLAYNIPVILWGAYVRVSFSGDGCGANWPFCNGQVIPHSMSAQTAIEFTHRMMTSLDSCGVIALCVWAFWLFPKRHAVRFFATWSLVFLFIEALLGAGLVLFRLVAHDQSAGRALYLSAHLTNTLLLLGSLTVTAWVAQTERMSLKLSALQGDRLASLLALVVVSVSGAIAALGDTLFPSAGVSQDFASSSAPLLRLRIFHPIIAVGGVAYVFWALVRTLKLPASDRDREAATRVLTIAGLQLGIGVLNIALSAPVWMQLIHLLVADLLWIATVIWALESSPVSRHFAPSQTV